MPKAFLNGSVGKDVWVLFNPSDMGASDKLRLQWPGTSIVPSKNMAMAMDTNDKMKLQWLWYLHCAIHKHWP